MKWREIDIPKAVILPDLHSFVSNSAMSCVIHHNGCRLWNDTFDRYGYFFGRWSCEDRWRKLICITIIRQLQRDFSLLSFNWMFCIKIYFEINVLGHERMERFGWYRDRNNRVQVCRLERDRLPSILLARHCNDESWRRHVMGISSYGSCGFWVIRL